MLNYIVYLMIIIELLITNLPAHQGFVENLPRTLRQVSSPTGDKLMSNAPQSIPANTQVSQGEELRIESSSLLHLILTLC